MFLIVKARGFFIPKWYRSKEIFQDSLGILQNIDYSSNWQIGDIVGLSSLEETDPKKIHVGILVKDEDDKWGVFHINNSGLKVDNLEVLKGKKKYEKLVFIKRPKFGSKLFENKQIQEKLGFI